MTLAEQLADAYRLVAGVNHYMVTVSAPGATMDDYREARQILISRQNIASALSQCAVSQEEGMIEEREMLDLALDLIESDLRKHWRLTP